MLRRPRKPCLQSRSPTRRRSYRPPSRSSRPSRPSPSRSSPRPLRAGARPRPAARGGRPVPALAPAPVALPELPAFPPLPDLPAAVLPELPEPPPAPVPDAVPVAAEAEKKVPFYKRELSRKPKAREGREGAEGSSRQARAPREGRAEPGAKVPFYKRDFSLKRGPKEWDAAEPASEPKSKSKSISVPKFSLPKLALPSRPRASLPVLPGSSSKKLVGLKIGGSQIAAALVNNGPTPELVQAVRAPLEHGVVVGGELRDPEALAVALRDFFKLHKLPKRGVRLGIANNRIGVRTFEVTGIDDPKQLANAIRFRAQEVLPIPLEEAVLDYQVLSESVNEEGQKVTRVLLVVAYRELVDRYVYACKKAGLQIVGIDLEAFALLRAVAEPHDPVPGSERGALVAVSVGHDRSTFAVSDGRVCEFTRVLEWGGWALNVAIARALDTSPSEAEPIKRALSFGAPIRGARRHQRGAPRSRAGGRQAAAADVRARARLLAPVLPEPARLAGYRRDRAHGRNRASPRPRRRARAARRRARPGRRSAHPPQGLQEGRRAGAARLARGRHRTRDRRLMRAVNLLPRDEVPEEFRGQARRRVRRRRRGRARDRRSDRADAQRRQRDQRPSGRGRHREGRARRDPDGPRRGGERRGRRGALGRAEHPLHRPLDRARGPRRLGQRASPGVAGPARGRLADQPHEHRARELRDRSQCRDRRRRRAGGLDLLAERGRAPHGPPRRRARPSPTFASSRA